MEIIDKDNFDSGNKTRSDTKVFAKDGKSLRSKYIKGEISQREYQNEICKANGYKDFNEYRKRMRHEKGENLPMSENKDCSSYLGVYICENKEFLSKIINIIENMPYGSSGYDVVCIKDKKIDVKCGCLKSNNTWGFHINKNKVADYFLMISFDDITNLNIEHIWLVRGTAVIEKTNNYFSKEFVVNEKDTININKGNIALKRWIKYEITDIYKLEEAQKLCDVFKNDNKYKDV